MIFDPLEYLMNSDVRRRDLEVNRSIELERIRMKLGEHDRRIGLLESWKASAMKTARKWPYIVVPITILIANIAPKETIEAVTKILGMVL